MRIEYAKAAVKVIGTLDRPTKKRIKEAIEKLPDGDVKALRGSENSFRLRVGDWRILWTYIAHDTILVAKIGPRGDVYKGV